MNKIIAYRKEYHRPYHEGTVIHRGRRRIDGGGEEAKGEDNNQICARKHINSGADRLSYAPRPPGQVLSVGGVRELFAASGIWTYVP